MKLLVTGCGRSGTAFASRWLRERGLDVGHERSGEHGIVSWCLAACEKDWRCIPPATRMAKLDLPSWHGEVSWRDEYTAIVHLVRSPLDAIASATTIGAESWEWIAQHIELDPGWSPLKKAATYWLRWNQLAEQMADVRVQVETVRHSMPRPVNARVHDRVTWRMLDEGDSDYHPAWAELRWGIREMAQRYGYGTED